MEPKLEDALHALLNMPHRTDEELFTSLRHLVSDYKGRYQPLKKSISIIDLFKETIEVVSNPKYIEQIIQSGFRGLDEITGGFYPGEMVVFGARPAMGKTQLLISIALHISKSHPLLYYSFDLSPIILTVRFISAITDIPVQKILTGNITKEQKITVNSAGYELNTRNIFVNETGYNSLSLMKDQIRQHCRDHSIRVVVIDYLQMMSSHRERNNREQEVGQICREMKNLAKEENLVVIVASQLSRSVEHRGGNKRPFLVDLRDSGTIEQDADKVIFLYRPKYYQIDRDDLGMSTEGVMDLIVAKNRNGGLGIASFMLNENFTKFTDYDPANTKFNIDSGRMDEFDVPF